MAFSASTVLGALGDGMVALFRAGKSIDAVTFVAVRRNPLAIKSVAVNPLRFQMVLTDCGDARPIHDRVVFVDLGTMRYSYVPW
jgi:hypothetical protein